MSALTKEFLTVLSLLVLLWLPGFSQDRTVTGRVTTKSGVGIASATIQASPSKRMAVTDSLGGFKITLAANDKTVLVSSVGFVAQPFAITSGSNFNFELADDPRVLSEIVVTAYGIKKEAKKLGYSVQELKGAELIKARDANPINSLTGKIAGLTVGPSSEMLGRPDIVLRGSKDLLFVVDGVPINTDTWNISPDDIESYSVLKGANASALYGFRGINGAIIITTKRGTKDRKGWQVDVNSSTMIEKGFVALPQSQTEYGRGTAFVYSYGDQLYDNKQRLPEWGPHFDGQLVKQFDSPYDLTTGIRTATPWTARGANNFSKFMQAGAINTNNISLSTTTDRSDFRLSVSNMNQKGMAPKQNCILTRWH